MILDSYSSRSSNVCNQLKKESHEETILLKRPNSSSSNLSPFNASVVLSSPRSVDDTMMDKSSRSSLVSSDIDELETSSTKSSDATNKTKQSKSNYSNASDQREPGQPSMLKNKEHEVKENEISHLVNDMKRLESTINSLRESTASQISQLEEMLNLKNKIIIDLEERLEQQRDYEEIKHELSLVRNELSHFTPVAPSLDQSHNPKAIEPFLADKSKNVQPESLKLDSTNNPSAQQMIQRHPFFNSFPLPQLQSLGNVESFGTLLGEEIANTYAKALVKRDPSFLAMAAAAAASNPNLNSNKLNVNSNNNLNVSLSPSHTSNCEEAMEEKSTSASTTPTSAMICSEGADPLNHSPLGATTVSDLGLNVSSYSPSTQNSPSYDKLQHQLRCNVEKYMNETLNTLQISRCVRELLSMHNIGQRLFAKYVLGLSQGTVSELLSKPKPWDKLTEKGRDSYRKMHAWATDERCINLLKSMVPRKGKDSAAYKQEDPVAEERINQILNEAQRSMKTLTRPDIFATNLFNGENLQGKIDKELKNNYINDNTSDNFSDHDEKPEVTPNDCRSPSVNATAMATINNFYRNFNDSPNFNDSRSRNRLKFCEGEENVMQSPDLMRLYQDHLTKLIGQHIEEGFRSTQNYGDVRNAISLYQQEMSRINPFAAQVSNPELFARLFSAGYGGLPLCLDPIQQSNQNQLNNLRKVNPQLDSPQPRDNREPLSCDVSTESRSKIENMLNQFKPEPASPSHNGALSGNNNNNNNSNNNNNHSANSVLNNSDLSAAEDLAASPLQRMQSITNSLLSQSSLPSLPSQPSRPTKAVLPPITQQQFDQYNNLNTEDIVKRVKEQLSQYSISQRLFGESVLGLSQGSVSDLLARPKPWHMLTQKGREPFIRMKMFLEDENAIHKLVASQYKIAPEKLMRTGSFVAGSTGIPNIAVAATVAPQISTPPSSLSISSNTSSNKNSHINKPIIDFGSKYEQSMSPNSTENGGRSNASTPELNLPILTNSAPSPISMRPRISVGYGNINNNLLRPTLSQSSGAYMQPSVYELAALTSDLDTQIITTRIKETLMAHNIGQKIFGEVVLGLSQGSVSELLSKPKPWNMLSIKGREPFIRMQLWLNDTNNIDKLQTLKNERREANKRRRTHMDDGFGFKPLDNKLFNFSNNFNMTNSIGKGLLSTSGQFPMSSMSTQPVVKKARILFTEEQKEALRIAFAMDPYPSSTTAEFLAKELNLSIRTITNWFHNHRMRLKQINTTANSNGDESNQATLPYNIGRDNVSFDQSQFRTLLSQRLSELKLRSGNVANSNNSSNGSSNNGNSNQYFGQNASGSPQHRFKYSSSMFQAQSLYSNNTNSCSSPESSSPFHEEEEMGTLDLSVSSHNQHRHLGLEKLDSTGRSSIHDDSDDGCRSGDDSEEIEIAPSDQDQPKSSLNLCNKKNIGSSRRKPQHVMSSSSRRKAAQPQQWVAPIDMAGISEDDYVEDDYEDCENESKSVDIARYGEHNKQSFSDKDKASEQTDDDDDNADVDDQKTDEDGDQTGNDSDADEKDSTPPPYKKLKSASACVMSKMSMSEDNSNVMQECVQ